MYPQSAACRGLDPNIFFPEDDDLESEAAAKVICSGCPVSAECLDHALSTNEKYGIWGGTNQAERKKMLRARKKSDP